MGLFKIFQRKKKTGKKPEKKPKEPLTPKKPLAPEKPIAAAKPKKIPEAASEILKGPHVTEKATDLAKKNMYVFKISDRSNKTEVKKAVEDAYGVKVVSVRIINIPSKKRRLGRIEGERKKYRKAVVRVAEGQKIEVLPK